MLETENTITKSSYRRENLLNEPRTHEIRKNVFGNLNLLDLCRNWGMSQIHSLFSLWALAEWILIWSIWAGLMLETENTITILISSWALSDMNPSWNKKEKENFFGNLNSLDLRGNRGCRLFIPYFSREYLLNGSWTQKRWKLKRNNRRHDWGRAYALNRKYDN